MKRLLRNKGQVSYTEKGDTLIVSIGGEIDHHSAVSVRTGIDQKLMELRPPRVMLELSAVDFMDSSGLGLIMGRYNTMKEIGGVLKVADPSPGTEKIMRLAGMERIVKVIHTSANAKRNTEQSPVTMTACTEPSGQTEKKRSRGREKRKES